MSTQPCINTGPVGVCGFYTICSYKTDANGAEVAGSRKQLAHFPNLITDTGLDGIGTDNLRTLDAYGAVGTGNTPPAFSDNSLANEIARVPMVNPSGFGHPTGVQTSAPYYAWARPSYIYGPGVATGNLTEVGIFKLSSAGPMYSRALILDDSGSPTSITKLPDETLEVTYEHRVYPPLGDKSGIVTIGSTDHSYTMRAASVNNKDAWLGNPIGGLGNFQGYTLQAYTNTTALGPITGTPNGSTAGINATNNATNSSYVLGTYQRDFTCVLALTMYNSVNGISGLTFRTGFGMFQAILDPPIMKDANKAGTLVFRCGPWARHTP